MINPKRAMMNPLLLLIFSFYHKLITSASFPLHSARCLFIQIGKYKTVSPEEISPSYLCNA